MRLGVAHVPEGRGTFTRMTTEENLQLGAMTRRDGKAIAADIERVYGYFPRLAERRTQQAGTLSGGEQQMLAIARAMMLRPRLMLLDEPSFGLAPRLVEELFAILRRLNEEERVAMLLVEQNAALALELADHAYLIETGRPGHVRAGARDRQRRERAPRLSRILRDARFRHPGPHVPRKRGPRAPTMRLDSRLRGDEAAVSELAGGWNCSCIRFWPGSRPAASMPAWRSPS